MTDDAGSAACASASWLACCCCCCCCWLSVCAAMALLASLRRSLSLISLRSSPSPSSLADFSSALRCAELRCLALLWCLLLPPLLCLDDALPPCFDDLELFVSSSSCCCCCCAACCSPPAVVPGAASGTPASAGCASSHVGPPAAATGAGLTSAPPWVPAASSALCATASSPHMQMLGGQLLTAQLSSHHLSVAVATMLTHCDAASAAGDSAGAAPAPAAAASAASDSAGCLLVCSVAARPTLRPWKLREETLLLTLLPPVARPALSVAPRAEAPGVSSSCTDDVDDDEATAAAALARPTRLLLCMPRPPSGRMGTPCFLRRCRGGGDPAPTLLLVSASCVFVCAAAAAASRFSVAASKTDGAAPSAPPPPIVSVEPVCAAEPSAGGAATWAEAEASSPWTPISAAVVGAAAVVVVVVPGWLGSCVRAAPSFSPCSPVPLAGSGESTRLSPCTPCTPSVASPTTAPPPATGVSRVACATEEVPGVCSPCAPVGWLAPPPALWKSEEAPLAPCTPPPPPPPLASPSGFSPCRPGMPAVMSDMGGTPCTGTAAPGGSAPSRRKSTPAWLPPFLLASRLVLAASTSCLPWALTVA